MGRRQLSSSQSKSRSKSSEKSQSRNRKSRSNIIISRSRSRNRSADLNRGTRLHIADIDPDLSTREVEKAFEKFGPLIEVWIARSAPCFGFVVFENKKDAADAVGELNGHTLGKKRLRVSYALPRVQDRRMGPTGRSIQNDYRCYQCGMRGHFSRDCNRNRFVRSPIRRRWLRSPIRSQRFRSRSISRSRSRGRRKHKKSKNMIDSDDGREDDDDNVSDSCDEKKRKDIKKKKIDKILENNVKTVERIHADNNSNDAVVVIN